MTIGKFLTALLRRNNMTQKDLASKLGVTPPQIYKWLNEERRIPDWHIYAMKQLFNLAGDERIQLTKLNPKNIQGQKPWIT